MGAKAWGRHPAGRGDSSGRVPCWALRVRKTTAAWWRTARKQRPTGATRPIRRAIGGLCYVPGAAVPHGHKAGGLGPNAGRQQGRPPSGGARREPLPASSLLVVAADSLRRSLARGLVTRGSASAPQGRPPSMSASASLLVPQRRRSCRMKSVLFCDVS